MEAGFTAFLTKPIRKVTLLEALLEHGAGKDTGAADLTGLSGSPIGPPAAMGRPAAKPASALSAVAGTAATVERNLIQVPEGLEDVVPGYLKKRRADVLVYTEALAREDFDSIKKLAHKMKGTGTGYGFPVLTDLGGALEKAAIEKDAARIRESLNRLGPYLDSIELKYVS
jgi:hypothetical protein